MLSRRRFMRKGLNAVALGVLARRGLANVWGPGSAPMSVGSNGDPLSWSRPFRPLPPDWPTEYLDGLPFAKGWTGDDYANAEIPFHSCQNCFPGGEPPAPTEEVDFAVVGGGLSGLTTAYLLRRHRPVLFEMRDRFGGNAQGEVWEDTFYSLGNAYVITPDPGTFLHTLYHKLGLHRVMRFHSGEDLVELYGEILDDFWEGLSEEDREAFERYAEVVDHMANVEYPDIPLPDDHAWILELDQKTFHQDIQDRMAMPIPDLLAAAIQAYCYSSFTAGWDEISAASGWNFLAAEEFGRWVFPGGAAYIADALWRKLVRLEERYGSPDDPQFLRSGKIVADVRLVEGDRVQVTYSDRDGNFSSLLARRVAMCCSKRVARHVIHDLNNLDPEKAEAIHSIYYNAYLVMNVLLNTPVDLDFYDIFLLGDGNFPMTPDEFQASSRVVDMLNGHYARPENSPRSVLTLYWPLPFAASRVRLIQPNSWKHYALELIPQIDYMLTLLGVDRSMVHQIRMSRWGHALPIAAPGLIANGTTDLLRRPIDGRIFFVNQDNWALPAVENCLLDAEIFVPQMLEGL